MSSLFHRVLGRAYSAHTRSLPCSHIPSFSPSILQRLRPQSQLRFFTSTPKTKSRPYPHRAYKNYGKPPFLGFLDRIPQDKIFWGIITINGVVFAMWTLTGLRANSENVLEPYYWMRDNFTASWHNFSEGRVWTPVTAIFSHEGVQHILFNGFTFYFMARPVLDFLGSRKFLFLYMGGGLISSVFGAAWSNLVKHDDTPSYGASGANYSAVSLLACVAPKATFLLYGVIPAPAWLLVTGIFAYDTYSTIYDKQPGTNTAGHVGGLLSGIAYYLALRLRIF